MQFLHTVHCVTFNNNFYNEHWNCYLFCLFTLVFKKRWCWCFAWYSYWNNNLLNLLMEQVTEIDIKNQTYYFLTTWLIWKIFTQTQLTINKKSHKDINVYSIRYIVIKKFSHCKNIHSVNPLYLIIHCATGYLKKTKKKNWGNILNSWFDRQIRRSFFWN